MFYIHRNVQRDVQRSWDRWSVLSFPAQSLAIKIAGVTVKFIVWILHTVITMKMHRSTYTYTHVNICEDIFIYIYIYIYLYIDCSEVRRPLNQSATVNECATFRWMLHTLSRISSRVGRHNRPPTHLFHTHTNSRRKPRSLCIRPPTRRQNARLYYTQFIYSPCAFARSWFACGWRGEG